LIEADRSYAGKFIHLMKPVKAVTVSTSTGCESTRKRLVEKFNPAIETMEGASFFYICARESIPFFAVRAISNRIETRNRDSWNIPLALDGLAEKLAEVFKILG
jgi:futalosine hydrolase